MLKKLDRKPKSDLARSIIERRRAKGWSQAVLAEQANIGLNTLKSIERDLSGGWPGTMEAIARALDCTVDELSISPTRLSSFLKKEAPKQTVADLPLDEFRAALSAIGLPTLTPCEQKLLDAWRNASKRPISRAIALLSLAPTPEHRQMVLQALMKPGQTSQAQKHFAEVRSALSDQKSKK